MRFDGEFKKMMWASVLGSFVASGIVLGGTWAMRRLGVGFVQ